MVLDLKEISRIFVVGGGKAGAAMAESLLTILGDRIDGGVVNVPVGAAAGHNTGPIELNESGHPIPNECGVRGARRMIQLISSAEEHDLVICLISGGGSALMPLPAEGIGLGDIQTVTAGLLRSGARIGEINAVRKHLSAIKGGWLAKRAHRARLLSLILSDVVDDKLDVIASGPTVPDETTFNTAVEILQKYSIWSQAPKSVRHLLLKGERGQVPETPKPGDEAFVKARNIIIGNNSMACEAAALALRKEGINVLMLTSRLEGEAREAGRVICSIVTEISKNDRPVPKPGAIVLGGETTVKVKGHGKGGRNQELALAASETLAACNGAVVVSVGTDGIDGITDAAGAIVDSGTLRRAGSKGLSTHVHLERNDSYTYFSQIGDLVLTGPTGTNVGDIVIAVAL